MQYALNILICGRLRIRHGSFQLGLVPSHSRDLPERAHEAYRSQAGTTLEPMHPAHSMSRLGRQPGTVTCIRCKPCRRDHFHKR